MDKQHLWDETWLQFADMMAVRHSKCASKSVACVIVKDEKPISIGLNGTPPGHTNCNEIFIKRDDGFYKRAEYVSANAVDLLETPVQIIHDGVTYIKCSDPYDHHNWSKQHEIHAEINAIGKLAADSTNAFGATAYVTHSPCHACSLALIASRVARVVYAVGYEHGDGLDLMRESGIDVVHMPLEKSFKNTL
ncbi:MULTISPECIES: deoxycytidylate deaminase [Exiguobacterium]|uniref:deoxycytidylate deaminase n=1 Tax=Exiguobacterium TaxID=33986 RepID=UPI001BE7F82B|nr:MULTISPECIES: deaminase [Exiguobacterium]MCT4775917.1 deaminase [Exiguobacterium aquaticum]MCT4788350.1 deaminase [Exiguobacterium mexicanum]